VIVGAPGSNRNNRRDAGAAFVVFGRPSTTAVRLSALGKQGFRIDGARALDFNGSAVAGVGDVDGDGLADVATGATGTDVSGRDQAGSVSVVLGSASTAPVDLAAPGPRATLITGSAGFEWAGGALSAGDVDGDGRPDLVIGASHAGHHGRPSAGAAYVVFDSALGGPVDLADLGARGLTIDGPRNGDWLGASVAAAGDVDGDGFGDVLVGAPKADPGGRLFAGSAWLVHGGPNGGTIDLAASPQLAVRFDGQRGGDTAGGDELGTSVSAAGDVDGDGLADVLIGAPWSEVPGRWAAGAAFLVQGGVAFGSVLGVGDGDPRVTRFLGAQAGDRTGTVGAAGDLDGDGAADLLVGAPFADRSGRPDAGVVHLIGGASLAP
jgi:FG-GAP repeat